MNLQVSRAKAYGGIGLITLFLLFPGPAFCQSRATVAQANLNQLVDNAQTIVRGSIVSAVVQPHPHFANLQTVAVTIAVAKTLKGQAVPTLTFRQFVWDANDLRNGGGYHKSEELLLFLNATSTYGLTSPVGMDQGHFRIFRDNKGNRTAVNGRGNVGLFSEVLTTSTSRGATISAQARAMLGKNAGPVSLSTLEQTIQALVAVRP
jgi:hypothetical protein